MDAALDSHFDLGSMYTYSPASKCSPTLPHQPSRPPRHAQYEICGLRILKKISIFDFSVQSFLQREPVFQEDYGSILGSRVHSQQQRHQEFQSQHILL